MMQKGEERVEGKDRQSRHYALIAAAQSGKDEAADAATETLICENMGLIRGAANRFRERGVEYEDLLQIGTIGMLRAIRSFDLSRGLAFSTYAVPLIVGEIRRYLRDDGLLRVSRNYKKLCVELCNARADILQREGREAGIGELAARCGVSREEAAVAMASATPVTSLSDPVFEEDKGELCENLVDEEGLHEAQLLNDKIALREAIGRMPPLWRKILLLRYYRDRTQQQTADALGLTQVKISREEKKILEFLRGELIV
jgi:RNA polymerase sporulation-specific sigma factor